MPQHDDATDALLMLFVVEKALYELRYELDHRPDWVHVPIDGLLELLRAAGEDGADLQAPVDGLLDLWRAAREGPQ